MAVVLVPFFLFEDVFAGLASRIQEGGMPAITTATVIAGLLAADIVLPVPSSIVSTAAGALLGFWNGAAVCWIGMTAGCLFGYALGSRAARGPASRLVGANDLERAASVVERYGDWALVVSRPVPVLAEASVIFAGIIRVPFKRFALITTLSNLGICLGYAAVGAFSMKLESFLLAFAGAILLPAGCGPCNDAVVGPLHAGEVSISTASNSNAGRFGSKQAKLYLGSPATVAASAVTGAIADPRSVSVPVVNRFVR